MEDVEVFNPRMRYTRSMKYGPVEVIESMFPNYLFARFDWTISLNLHPRVAGSPILAGNKVVGVCVASREAERNKLPAVSLAVLKKFLGEDAQPGSASGDPTSNLLQLVSTRETE